MNIYKIEHYSVRPVQATTYVAAPDYESAIGEVVQMGRAREEDILSVSLVNDPKWPALVTYGD